MSDPPRPGVRSFEELLARAAGAAVAISRAHRSGWNGRLLPMPPGSGDHIALAAWDGTLHLDDKQIVEPLRRMFGRRQHKAAALIQFRSALRALLHENVHLLVPPGRHFGGPEQRAAYNQDTAARALDEGATEAWTIRNLDRFIDELGLEEVAPGIKGVTATAKYPHYVAAADEFAERIGEFTGLGRDEVLRRFVTESTDRLWQVSVDLMYDHSALPRLQLSGPEVAEAKARIDAAMRTPYSFLAELEDHPDNPHAQRRAAELGHEVGTVTFADALATVTALEQRHRQTPSDLAALRAAHGAVAPLTHTQRLDPDGFGSRSPATDTDPTHSGRDRSIDRSDR